MKRLTSQQNMRIILLFILLLFPAGFGCTPSDPPSAERTPVDSEPIADPPIYSEPPLVEPLVPKVDPPIETPPASGNNVSDFAVPDSAGNVSQPLGKYAAETVPLPPVEDLTAQLDAYVIKIGTNLEILESSTRYFADAADIRRDVHVLSLIAWSIGLSKSASPYKQSAAQIIAAAQNLADAQTFESGQKAFAELQSAKTNASGGMPFSSQQISLQQKIADLPSLMKAVPNINTTVKRLTNTEQKLLTQLKKNPAQIYGSLAALAAISQGSIAHAADTVKPEAGEQWKKFCEEMRDAALAANAAAHQFAEKNAGYEKFKSAQNDINISCDQCHEVFYPGAMGLE